MSAELIAPAERVEAGRHMLVFGASGNRAGCRVCRLMDPVIGWGDRADFSKPCRPTEEALAKFEAVETERLEEAKANLAYAAALRALAHKDQDQ